LPARKDLKITVREGDRVRAGESIVAVIAPAFSKRITECHDAGGVHHPTWTQIARNT
jgi:hypothetical protein